MGKDCQYQQVKYISNEIKHLYGENVHILSNPYISRLLATLSSPESSMPLINLYIEQLYTIMLEKVVNTMTPLETDCIKTRMDANLEGEFLKSDQHFICVDLARAGTYPAQICFHQLNLLFKNSGVRQDHIYLNRRVDEGGKVIGVDYSGSKIGGDQEESIVLFPDPMGATGGSLAHVINQYKTSVEGKAFRYVAMHLIVTPEYLAHMKAHHPDVEIFTARLDRGLSSDAVLSTIPGTKWDEEKGLNDFQYIVPGAGGVGELLNNTKN